MSWYLGIDPGSDTGVVIGFVHERKLSVERNIVLPWHRRFELKAFVCTNPALEAIVIEQFTLYAHKAQDQIGQTFPSVRVIGLVEAYAHACGIHDRIVFQMASVRSRVQIVHELSASPHVKDAYRHLRYFLAVNDLID